MTEEVVIHGVTRKEGFYWVSFDGEDWKIVRLRYDNIKKWNVQEFDWSCPVPLDQMLSWYWGYSVRHYAETDDAIHSQLDEAVGSVDKLRSENRDLKLEIDRMLEKGIVYQCDWVRQVNKRRAEHKLLPLIEHQDGTLIVQEPGL